MRSSIGLLAVGFALGVGATMLVEPAKGALTRPEYFGCKPAEDRDTLVCTGYNHQRSTFTTYAVRGMKTLIAEIGTDKHDEGASIDCRFYYGGFVRECSFAVG